MIRRWVAAAVVAALAAAGSPGLGGSTAEPLSERQAPDDSYSVVRLDSADEPSDVAAEPVVPVGSGSEPIDEGPPPPPRVADDFAVLFDGRWLVVEGVWSIAPYGDYPLSDLGGLLTLSRDRRGAVLSGPALYGKYRVRVERHSDPPPVPASCEDVVEVSLRHDDAGLQMGSFESWTRVWAVPRGDLRVRWCARRLDTVERETAAGEFRGRGYKTYSGRQLIQVWAAPYAARSVVRLGSKFAKAYERG